MTGKKMNNQILLTSRIRLARNIEGYPFPNKISKEEAQDLKEKIIETLDGREDVWVHYDLTHMSPLEAMYSIEENRISYQLLNNKSMSSFFVGEGKEVLMFLEEDHLRMQDMRKGFFLKEEYENLAKLSAELEEEMNFSFDEKLGYLTACPTNIGTGIRASCMLHLPGLDHFGMDNINRSINRMGFVLRGMNGEGTKSVGNIYQISNERTLGLSEEEFVKRAQSLTMEIMGLEKIKRKELYLDHLIDLEDMARRSYGILRNARILGYEESLKHLSRIKLGIELSVLKPNKEFDFYDEVVSLGKAHLQIEKGSYLDTKSGDIYRANRARELMREVF